MFVETCRWHVSGLLVDLSVMNDGEVFVI